MVVTSEHALPQLVERVSHSGHHHRRKQCCRSSSSRQQRACKHKGRLGGGRRARGPLIPVQEQQGRNQGRLERERKQKKAPAASRACTTIASPTSSCEAKWSGGRENGASLRNASNTVSRNTALPSESTPSVG